MLKKVKALILTADKFEDMEFFFPYFRLLDEGLEVDVAAPKKGHIEGEHGYGFEVEKTFDDAHPEDYDLLLLAVRQMEPRRWLERTLVPRLLLSLFSIPINLFLQSVMALGFWLPQD
ncbi:MAG: DJ-1/PfpI family protein [Candidatus Bathyarchaeia archaeon]|jgi:putative intracellular protease/amidase